MTDHRHYDIPFTKREDFELAWLHLVKVKSKGAPVFLVQGPNFFLGKGSKAGVVVYSPPVGQADNPATLEAPINSAEEKVAYWKVKNASEALSPIVVLQRAD